MGICLNCFQFFRIEGAELELGVLSQSPGVLKLLQPPPLVVLMGLVILIPVLPEYHNISLYTPRVFISSHQVYFGLLLVFFGPGRHTVITIRVYGPILHTACLTISLFSLFSIKYIRVNIRVSIFRKYNFFNFYFIISTSYYPIGSACSRRKLYDFTLKLVFKPY